MLIGPHGMPRASNAASQWAFGCVAVTASIRAMSAARLRTRADVSANSAIAGPFGMAEERREIREQPIRAGADRDVAVGAANRLIRRQEPMRRAHRLAAATPLAKNSAASHAESARPASRSDVSMYWPRPVRWRWCSAARIAASAKSPAPRSVSGTPDLDRRPAGLAGHRHQSGRALRDEIESALRPVGSRLAVAGD